MITEFGTYFTFNQERESYYIIFVDEVVDYLTAEGYDVKFEYFVNSGFVLSHH